MCAPCAQFKDFLAALMQTVTIDYLNNLAKSVMSFASHYGHEAECLAEAEADGQTWGWMGPTRCTAIIACIPAFTDSSGLSVGKLCDQCTRAHELHACLPCLMSTW